MNDFFDALETRDPAEREAAMMAALPARALAGKPVKGYFTFLGTRDYYVASAADELVRNLIVAMGDRLRKFIDDDLTATQRLLTELGFVR